jgi:hypothetical protein
LCFWLELCFLAGIVLHLLALLKASMQG